LTAILPPGSGPAAVPDAPIGLSELDTDVLIMASESEPSAYPLYRADSTVIDSTFAHTCPAEAARVVRTCGDGSVKARLRLSSTPLSKPSTAPSSRIALQSPQLDGTRSRARDIRLRRSGEARSLASEALCSRRRRRLEKTEHTRQVTEESAGRECYRPSRFEGVFLQWVSSIFPAKVAVRAAPCCHSSVINRQWSMVAVFQQP